MFVLPYSCDNVAGLGLFEKGQEELIIELGLCIDVGRLSTNILLSFITSSG